MKILIYGINYAPEVTSTGKYTGEMGEWLAARGHEVRVVTAPPYYPAWRVGKGYSAWRYRRERVADAEVWRCPLWVPREPSGAKRLVHLASFAASSLPAMLQQIPWRPDVIVTVQPPLFCAPVAWLTARLCGARMWLHVQDFELDAAVGLGMLGGGGARRLMYGVEKYLLQAANRVSTITEAMRRRLLEKGVPEGRTRLFPNWSDIGFVHPMEGDDGMRKNLGAQPDDVLVLYTGNMGKKQGLELVLDAADRLGDRPEIQFALVGAGVERERLEREAEERKLDNVRFFPVQPLELLPATLAAGNVHLVVQRGEAADLVMPSKLTNILAAGRPCIATANPRTTLHDIVDGHGCGITVTPGNVEEFVGGIVALTEEPEKRRRLGRSARRYAEDHLDGEKILVRFEHELRRLAKGEA